MKDFRSENGLHKVKKGLFDISALHSEERRKELYQCLMDIRNISDSKNLVLTDTHRFLQVLQETGKLQRCYTQNIDGLEIRAGLNADITSEDCEVVQFHGSIKDLRCSFCSHLTAWNSVPEAALISGELLPCPNCQSFRENRRKRNARTNIASGKLRPNIVLFHDIDDPLSARKANLIDKDCESQPDILLIMGTSLAIEGAKHELKSRLIPAVRDNGGTVIYVNNNPPPKAFQKPVVDHIFVTDCDVWVRDLALRKFTLWDKRSIGGFNFQPQAQTVEEVIQAAENELVSIGDYSSMPLRFRSKEEVREDLGTFLPGRWLSTSPLMCVLSLLGWNTSTFVLHSKYTDNVSMQKNLKGPVWPIGRNHTRIIVPHNPGAHWILIEIDVPARTVYYYDSMYKNVPNAICEYVQAQMKRVGEKFGEDYSVWNSPVNGVSAQFCVYDNIS